MTLLDAAQFREPPAEYRPVAMWFLNGNPVEDELLRQIRAMAEGGIGGVQVAARTGLTTPYLSERWFDLVVLIAEEARRHGMDVWLADEYPYPSGAAGGEVILRHPEYRAWRMRATQTLAEPGQELQAVAPGTVLLRACAVPVVEGTARWDQAVPLDDHAGLVQREQVLYQPARVYLTTRRYMANDPRPTLQWRAPHGPPGTERWQVWLIAAAEIERYKFFGAYVDLCNPDAVRCFLETTYERYLERLGPERFAQLAGFFVDESHPQDWSWRLPDAFRRRCGYDLYDALPALWTDAGPRTAQVRYDYMQSITELFVESFHRPLATWCREHGVELSLEVGSPRNVVQRYAHVPGIDPGHDKAGTPLDEIMDRELPSFRGNLSFPASLAAQTGKRRVLDELFHSVGWSLTLQDMKAMLDRAAARGANLFAFHGFCYTIAGLRKWDAPPSEFDQNPYWPHFPLLASYAGRLAYAMSRGRRVAPIALLDPITSLWAHGGATRQWAIGAGPDKTAQRLAADWTYLMREFAAAQRPHDNLDPSLLAEATIEDGVLRLGEAAYWAVVLPPMTTLEQAAWQKLEQFAGSGGTVIACGLLPYEQIEPDSDVIDRCAAAFEADPLRLRTDYETDDAREGAASTAGEITRAGGFVLLRTTGTLAQSGAAPALLELLEELVPAELRLAPAGAAAARRQFLLAQRRDGDEDLYLLVNAGVAEHECDLALRVAGGRPATVTRLDLETGAMEPLHTAVAPATNEQRLRLRFPRHGAQLLLVTRGTEERRTKNEERRTDSSVVRPSSTAPGATGTFDAGSAPAEVSLDLDGEWQVTPAGDNVLRLDRFRFTTTEDQGEAEQPDLPLGAAALAQPDVPIVEPKPLVNVLQDLERAGQSWPVRVEAAPIFGASPELRLKLPTVAWYAATFAAQRVPSSVKLCLEDLALQGDWSLWVNGSLVNRDDFAASRRWTVGNLEAEVAPLLRIGVNEVLVRVRGVEPWDGLVEPLYLLGDFAVALDPTGTPAIVAPPSHVRWDDLFGPASSRGGYPYFAGTLHLRKTVQITSPPPDETLVRLPDEALMFAGVAQLAINGHALGVRPWAPFAWRAPAGVLRPGENDITLSVTNTLIGQLEGKRYDPQRRQTVPLVPEVTPQDTR